MKRGLILVFLFCIPFVVAHDKPDFNFQFYNGVTHWSVEVTENAGACGEVHEITKVYPVAIHNNGQTATIDDYGHGALRGKFTAPFTLHFDQMTVPDSGGQSDLEEHDIQISRDCTSFVASYYWTYYDQYQRCTGSTGLKGTRTDGTNCPQYGVSLATPHPVVQPPQSPVQTKEQELLNVLSR
ncbi:MAG TPA: hypothetical protein VLJ21_04695, partial [Candidatus Binatia bacterium]|nr:hypothetical protein [Candidatus Binatia bacterium]